MADKERVLEEQVSRAVVASNGSLVSRMTTTQTLGEDLGYRLPLSRNPVLTFSTDSLPGTYIAYTLLVDGRRRVASRVEALGGALAASHGRLFERFPFLLIFDYSGKRALGVSAAALFGKFLDETRTRVIPSSSTATFSLTPNFDNETISMYALLGRPDVWSIRFDDPLHAVFDIREGLRQVQLDTDAARPIFGDIVRAVTDRVSGDQGGDQEGPSPPLPQLVTPPTSRFIAPPSGARWKEEPDSSGRGSGVEAEDEGEYDQSVREPFDPDEIEVQTRQITIDLLLSRLRHKAIDLDPEFQRRRGIWNDQRQSRLIESILLKIPLPTLYAAEDKDENWIIVDGIQRLTAIARFASPEATGDKQLHLSGLEYLGPAFAGITMGGLDSRLKRRLLETELVLHVIRFGTPDAVKDNIFARINTGGIPLSRQELRHALIPGTSRRLLKDWAESAEFMLATDGSVSRERMNDRELVLRFASFSLSPPADYASRDFDKFLGDTMRRMNSLDSEAIEDLWQDLKRALTLSHRVFGDRAFRKQYQIGGARSPINKALFEVVTVTLSRLEEAAGSYLIEQRSLVNDKFVDLMHDRAFESSISQGTGDIGKVRTRFALFRQLVDEVLS